MDVNAGNGIAIDTNNMVTAKITGGLTPLVSNAHGGLGFAMDGGLAVAAGRGLGFNTGNGELGIRFSNQNLGDATPVDNTGLAVDSNGGVRLAIKPYAMTPMTLDPDGYLTVNGSSSISTYSAGGGQLAVDPQGLYEEEYDIDDAMVSVSYDLNGASTLPSGQYIPLTVTMLDTRGLTLMTRFLLTTTTGLQANRLDYRVESVNYQNKANTIVVRFGIRFVGDNVTMDYQLDGTTFKLVPYRMVARGPEQGN